MSLLDNAKRDWKEFSQADFGVNLTFTNSESLSVQIKGLATTHHLSIDPDTGQMVNTKNAHCSFSEELLTGEGYTVRDANDEVNMVGHIVEYNDSTGTTKKYRINDVYPDETIGMIVCILGESL